MVGFRILMNGGRQALCQGYLDFQVSHDLPVNGLLTTMLQRFSELYREASANNFAQSGKNSPSPHEKTAASAIFRMSGVEKLFTEG